MGMLDSDALPSQPKRHLTSTVFARPHRTKFEESDLQIPTRQVQKLFDATSKMVSENLQLRWQPGTWPRPSEVVEPSQMYRYLNHPEYAADFSLMILTQLHEIGPEIPMVMYSRHRISHVFIVSLDDIGKQDEEWMRQAADTAPVAAWREDDRQLYRPGFKFEMGPFEYVQPSKQGILSVHTLQNILKKNDRVRDLLALVCVQKYEDFRRKDIDADGKTLPASSLTDNLRGIEIEDDDPAEQWKPDDYVPPWEQQDEE